MIKFNHNASIAPIQDVKSISLQRAPYMPQNKMTYEICTDSETLNMAKMCKSVFQPLRSSRGDIILDGIVAEQRGYSKGQEWVSGHVNLGNRIFTQGVVFFLGDYNFKITPAGTEPLENPLQRMFFFKNQSTEKNSAVTATIDGKWYEGAEILISENSVIVEEQEASKIEIK